MRFCSVFLDGAAPDGGVMRRAELSKNIPVMAGGSAGEGGILRPEVRWNFYGECDGLSEMCSRRMCS